MSYGTTRDGLITRLSLLVVQNLSQHCVNTGIFRRNIKSKGTCSRWIVREANLLRIPELSK